MMYYVTSLVKIVTGTPYSTNNIKEKNKQNNQNKRKKYQELVITYACRCKQQKIEVMTSQKLNLDWLTYSEIKHWDEKCSAAKHLRVAANYWGDISNVIATMNPYKSSWNGPGSLTLWSKPFLEGFVWSHQSKPVLISLYKFVLRDWFLEKGHFFMLFFLNMLTNP